jgi:hypothetical protein
MRQPSAALDRPDAVTPMIRLAHPVDLRLEWGHALFEDGDNGEEL